MKQIVANYNADKIKIKTKNKNNCNFFSCEMIV